MGTRTALQTSASLGVDQDFCPISIRTHTRTHIHTYIMIVPVYRVATGLGGELIILGETSTEQKTFFISRGEDGKQTASACSSGNIGVKN